MGNLKLVSASKVLDVSLQLMVSSQQVLVTRFSRALRMRNDELLMESAALLQQSGVGWNRTNSVSILSLGQVLYAFMHSWEELPDEFVSQYEHSFDRFIQENYQLSPGRAREYINDWEMLASRQYKKQLPKGADPYALNAGRLRAAAILVEQSEMNARKWNALTDNNLTNRQAFAAVFGNGKTHRGRQKKAHYQLLSGTGELRVISNEGIKHLGSLDYMSKDRVVQTAIAVITKLLGVEIVP